MSDSNAFASSGNAFLDSRFNARGRREIFLGASQSGGSAGFVTGKIDDGFQFYAFAAMFPLPSFRWNLFMVGEPETGWGRKSFTIRQWFRPGSADSSTLSALMGYSETFLLRFQGGGPHFDIPVLQWRVPFSNPALGTVEDGPLEDFELETWHRIVAWYDKEGLEIGLQLDDRAPVTDSISAAIPDGSTQGFAIDENHSLPPVGNTDISFDEIGLWHDYVWTDAERAADWNGGAGIGWPDVLSTISRPPMAYWRLESEDATASGIASMVDLG